MPATKNSIRTWRLIESGPGTADRNMAFDELLLKQAAAGQEGAVLRLYAWDPPAVSIGRFQDEHDAVNADACRELGIDIVRRASGGRAVLHHQELTYSIVCPADDQLFPGDVLGDYRVIALGLLAGLENLGIGAEMVSRAGRHRALVQKKVRDASCFSSPSWYEIMARGRKIIGSAQRRLPKAFLQHGSILLRRDPELEARVIPGGGRAGRATSISEELGRMPPHDEVARAIIQGFSRALGIRFERAFDMAEQGRCDR